MTENNSLKEAFGLLRYEWRHRKGMKVPLLGWQITKDNSIPAAVLDVIDVFWRNDLKPLIIKTLEEETRYKFIINLPPGVSYPDFKKKEQYFEDATHGAVQIEKRGKAIFMDVMTESLKNEYTYQFDWEKYPDMHLPVPFGYSAAGLIVKDLAGAPNLISAGHPGAGKSNFLHVLAVSLLLARKVYMAIVDLKVLEFSYLKERALVVSDEATTLELLTAINNKLTERLYELEKAGVVKVQDYPGEMPFIVLIIDELAELHNEDCQELLNRIVRLGRAAGICVVAATQRPSSTMFKKFGDSKAMFSATMCFHVRDEVNSRMLLDNDRASLIPNVPGRAIYQWDRELEVQSMYLPVKKAKKLLKGVKQGVSFVEQSPKKLPPR